MSTRTRLALLELALYAVALWVSVEMAKTDEQLRAARLKRYWRSAETCWWLASEIGQLGMRAELAYMKEINA